MNKFFCSSLILLFVSLKAFSQQDPALIRNFRTIVFWNVENLYDAKKDPISKDDDYLPSGQKQWSEERYKKKISDISDVLSSINQDELPVLIGLAEVENQKVIDDLSNSQKLRNGKYGSVHFDETDNDGLEVALLYKKDDVEILGSKTIPITTTFDIKVSFRDVLYVKCRLKEDNIYHLFITHWPSRAIDDQDELKRISAAISLRKEIDNVMNLENNARIIIMGDLNDEPTNKSLMQMLNATNKRKNVGYRDLFNMMYDIHNLGENGTYSVNKKLYMFDQIIVSAELFSNKSGYSLSFDDGKVFKGIETSSKDTVPGLKQPEPTYIGNKYMGGTGSHFPVYIVLRKSVR
jgi:hypothetical protein